MVKKLIGYIISIIGLIGLLITNVAKVKEAINLNLPIDDKSLMILSLALVIIGVVLAAKGGKRASKTKEKDIPVRKDGEVIEYKRE